LKAKREKIELQKKALNNLRIFNKTGKGKNSYDEYFIPSLCIYEVNFGVALQ